MNRLLIRNPYIMFPVPSLRAVHAGTPRSRIFPLSGSCPGRSFFVCSSNILPIYRYEEYSKNIRRKQDSGRGQIGRRWGGSGGKRGNGFFPMKRAVYHGADDFFFTYLKDGVPEGTNEQRGCACFDTPAFFYVRFAALFPFPAEPLYWNLPNTFNRVSGLSKSIFSLSINAFISCCFSLGNSDSNVFAFRNFLILPSI